MNNVERLRELIGDLSHDAVREVGIRALRVAELSGLTSGRFR